MDIADNISRIKKELPSGVKLVAVSKFHPVSCIQEAYDSGQKCFGESRVQEFCEKYEILPKDIEWHFIGHLQTNKVKKIIGKTALIESVDSERLLELIDEESAKAGLVTNVLMQVHVAQEETKFGFYPDELIGYFESRGFEKLKATHICGVMGMATNTDDMQRVTEDFKKIEETFRLIRDNESYSLRGFDVLSMGMSGDWRQAVECGSNNVRIGSSIFGLRNYQN